MPELRHTRYIALIRDRVIDSPVSYAGRR